MPAAGDGGRQYFASVSDPHLPGPLGHYQSLLLVTTWYPFHAPSLVFSISMAGPELVEKGGTQPRLAS